MRSKKTTSYDYNNVDALRNALRDLALLDSSAENGDFKALDIVLDLKARLNGEVIDEFSLTEHQRKCIDLCLIQNKTETEVAIMFHTSQQSVHYGIKAGLKKLKRALAGDRPTVKHFRPEEVVRLTDLYKAGNCTKDIAVILNKPFTTVRNRIQYMRQSKGLRRGTE
jgi:DNA-directed RNA polymerase specialized sigma24 family protein